MYPVGQPGTGSEKTTKRWMAIRRMVMSHSCQSTQKSCRKELLVNGCGGSWWWKADDAPALEYMVGNRSSSSDVLQCGGEEVVEVSIEESVCVPCRSDS